jgi:hypothetical protein
MEILNQEQRASIERLAIFCMANVRNDSDIISHSISPVFSEAKQVYIELFGIPNSENIIEVTFALFNQYIHGLEKTDEKQIDSTTQVKPTISELKRSAIALELRLNLCAPHQSLFLKYMSMLIKLRSCTESLYSLLVDYDRSSANAVILHLKMIRESISSATDNGALSLACQYVTILNDSFNYVLDDYLVCATSSIQQSCNQDIDVLLQYLDSYQNILDTLGTSSQPTFSVFKFRLKQELQVERLFKILIAYTNLCIARTSSCQNLETQALCINEALTTLKIITDKNQKDRLNFNKLTNSIIQSHMALWRETGQIQTQEALTEKINCLSKWKLHLSGKQLKRALRMLLNAEKEYMDNLQTNDLKQYYNEVISVTIGVPIIVQVDTELKAECSALIHGYHFQLHQVFVNRLNAICPGWDKMTKDTTPYYYCHPTP